MQNRTIVKEIVPEVPVGREVEYLTKKINKLYKMPPESSDPKVEELWITKKKRSAEFILAAFDIPNNTLDVKL